MYWNGWKQYAVKIEIPFVLNGGCVEVTDDLLEQARKKLAERAAEHIAQHARLIVKDPSKSAGAMDFIDGEVIIGLRFAFEPEERAGDE